MKALKIMFVPAAVGLLAPAALALTGGATYAGKTSDGHAVTLRLNSTAKRIKRMRINYAVRCDNGAHGSTYTDLLNVKLRKDHSFWSAGSYTGSTDGSQNSFVASGVVYKKRAHGKFSLTATGTDSSGVPVTCKSGRLNWSAKRQK